MEQNWGDDQEPVFPPNPAEVPASPGQIKSLVDMASELLDKYGLEQVSTYFPFQTDSGFVKLRFGKDKDYDGKEILSSAIIFGNTDGTDGEDDFLAMSFGEDIRLVNLEHPTDDTELTDEILDRAIQSCQELQEIFDPQSAEDSLLIQALRALMAKRYQYDTGASVMISLPGKHVLHASQVISQIIASHTSDFAVSKSFHLEDDVSETEIFLTTFEATNPEIYPHVPSMHIQVDFGAGTNVELKVNQTGEAYADEQDRQLEIDVHSVRPTMHHIEVLREAVEFASVESSAEDADEDETEEANFTERHSDIWRELVPRVKEALIVYNVTPKTDVHAVQYVQGVLNGLLDELRDKFEHAYHLMRQNVGETTHSSLNLPQIDRLLLGSMARYMFSVRNKIVFQTPYTYLFKGSGYELNLNQGWQSYIEYEDIKIFDPRCRGEESLYVTGLYTEAGITYRCAIPLELCKVANFSPLDN